MQKNPQKKTILFKGARGAIGQFCRRFISLRDFGVSTILGHYLLFLTKSLNTASGFLFQYVVPKKSQKETK